jgi:hypothetical protein
MDGKFPGHADLVSGAARLVIVGSALLQSGSAWLLTDL